MTKGPWQLHGSCARRRFRQQRIESPQRILDALGRLPSTHHDLDRAHLIVEENHAKERDSEGEIGVDDTNSTTAKNQCLRSDPSARQDGTEDAGAAAGPRLRSEGIVACKVPPLENSR